MQKADRTPVSGLDLVEHAYFTRVTSDGFILREGRLFDLVSGAHFSEKLAEVREELADAFVMGLASLGPRTPRRTGARPRQAGPRD